MVVKKKSKFVSIATIVLLSIVIALNIAFSLAWFSDSVSHNETIYFGTIKLTSNKDGWFSSTQNYYTSVKPNDIILNEDVKFNLDSDSQPLYVRVKYDVTGTITNSEVLKVYNYLKYRELNLSTASDYKWSEKKGNYYYLLDASGNPLAVESVRNSDYVFLTTANSQISNDLEFDSTLVNNESIKISISIEAIQKANLDGASTNSLIDDIETELNTINNVSKTGTFSVTFDLNGTKTTQSGIAYGGSVDIPATIQTAMGATDFEGFSLWDNGLGIIKSTTNNHSFIGNNKINNITENITLYVKNTTQKYLVEFYNDTTLIQSYLVKAGENAEYYGVTPTKDGYVFSGWDKSLTNITANTTFYAQFEEVV